MSKNITFQYESEQDDEHSYKHNGNETGQRSQQIAICQASSTGTLLQLMPFMPQLSLMP
tara:strand:- start:6156 stop:6332 length:177 start_codon:yes stop_codon:yes gene_type:complete